MDIMQQFACLVLNPKPGPIMAQLEIFVSSDYREPWAFFFVSS